MLVIEDELESKWSDGRGDGFILVPKHSANRGQRETKHA